MAEEIVNTDALDDDTDGIAETMEGIDVEAQMMDDEGEMLIEDEGEEDMGEDMGEDDEDEEEEGMMMINEEEEIEEMAAHVLSQHTDSVYACAINPGNQDVITGGGDDRALLHKKQGGEYASAVELGGHTDSVSCVGFSHDGALCASGGYDGTVQIWNSEGARQRVLEGPTDVEWLEWHPRGDVILAGGSDGTCWMWMAQSGECLRVFAGHDGPVLCGGFTCDGKGIVTGSADGTVRSWAPKKGSCKHVFDGKSNMKSTGAITALAVHPTDPELLACAAEDGSAAVLHLKTKRVLANLPHSTSETALEYIGTSAQRREALEVKVENGEAMSVVAVGLAAEPANWAATGGVDGALKIWDYGGASLTCRVSCPHDAAVTALKWHPKQPTVYTSSADSTIRLWEARSGALLKKFTGHSDVVLDLGVVFAPLSSDEPDCIVAAGDDNTARVFKFNQPKLT